MWAMKQIMIKIAKRENINVSCIPEVHLHEVQVKTKRQTNYISSMTSVKTEKIEAGEQKAACCNLSESFQTNASARRKL